MPTYDDMKTLFNFFIELDKLKSVYRSAYVTDQSRHENSAEHSWHLAMALLTLKDELDIDIDLMKALEMALVHDVCEIGAGDVPIFDPARDEIIVKEREYIENLSSFDLTIVPKIQELWEEYEAQDTRESQWVKVIDRLLPFMINLVNEGRTWRDFSAKKSQVIEINQLVAQRAPEIYKWVLNEIDKAVEKGWLIDE